MPGQSGTILIIDDDPSVRKVAQFRLEREGYRVLVASNGDEGLRLAKAERPGVILLDILMPGMNGREVLRRLKGDAETSPIPVILLTVVEAHDELTDPIGPGWIDRVSKPYNPDQLLQAVQRVLSAKPSA